MIDRGSRRSKLMKIFDLENDFLKHREKIIKTQRKDVSFNMKKTYNSQMQMINSFRKNWAHSNNLKYIQKQKQITHTNKLLHDSLFKEYNRERSTTGPGPKMSRTISSNSSSRVSLNSSKSKREIVINKQNERLMKKILSIQSSLSHNKMQNLYQRNKANRQKLQVYSSRNKQKLRNTLRKMKIEPSVYFPKMRNKYSTIK